MAQLRATSTSAAPEPPFNKRKIAHNLGAFRRLFPHLGEIALETAWSGRIDLTPDVIPIMDNPMPGLFIAAGFSGHGFALGPSVGRQMAAWIAQGRPMLDLAPFRLSRFNDGGAAPAKHAL